jgi:hypothetical protein
LIYEHCRETTWTLMRPPSLESVRGANEQTYWNRRFIPES